MKRQTENRAAQLSFARTDKCGSQEHGTEAILEREAKAEKRRFDLIKEVLLDFEPTLAEEKERETYQTAFVLLAALSCGSDISPLLRFTHLPVDLIAPVRHRMIEAELWTESNTFCEHWFTSDDRLRVIPFWLDILVARGTLVRRWAEDKGDYKYILKKYVSDSEKTNQA